MNPFAVRLMGKFKLTAEEALTLVEAGLPTPEAVKKAKDEEIRDAAGADGLKKVRAVWPKGA